MKVARASGPTLSEGGEGLGADAEDAVLESRLRLAEDGEDLLADVGDAVDVDREDDGLGLAAEFAEPAISGDAGLAADGPDGEDDDLALVCVQEVLELRGGERGDRLELAVGERIDPRVIRAAAAAERQGQ